MKHHRGSVSSAHLGTNNKIMEMLAKGQNR